MKGAHDRSGTEDSARVNALPRFSLSKVPVGSDELAGITREVIFSTGWGFGDSFLLVPVGLKIFAKEEICIPSAF